MNIWMGMILRAGITWGIVAILVAILSSVLAPVLPQVEGLTVASFAFLLAGIHYTAKARSDFLQAILGGGASGALAAIVLLLVRFIPVLNLPSPTGAPGDLLAAVIIGFVAGAFGALAYKLIIR